MVPVGESRLELLEATSENSTIAKFIAKRGEGLHHVCLKVPDLAAAVERLKKDGVRLVSEEIKNPVRADTAMCLFILPAPGECCSNWSIRVEREVNERDKLEGEIREIVDRETGAWDTQDVDLLITIFHPDMVWPWPRSAASHDPMDWVFLLGAL